MKKWLLALLPAIYLLFAGPAHAQFNPCTTFTGRPWVQGNCLNAADLEAAFARTANIISAPAPLGGSLDDRPNIQAFLNTNCSKGSLAFFGAYNVSYPGLSPPRNCVYGGATTWSASGNAVSALPAPTTFTAIGTWSDNLHCIINQNHDGQYVHDLTLVGLNGAGGQIVSPQVCGIRALNSVQWSWVNVNTFGAFRGKELIGGANQPCGDSECFTAVGQIIYGADVRNSAEGLYANNVLPGGTSGGFVSDMLVIGYEGENNCIGLGLLSVTNSPSGVCSTIGLYGSFTGFHLEAGFKAEDNFNNSAYGFIAWNTDDIVLDGFGFDLNQQAAIWLQNDDHIMLNNVFSTREQQAAAGCGHIRISGAINDLRMSGANSFDNTTQIFEADKAATGLVGIRWGSVQVALNDGGTSGFDGTGNQLYCPPASGVNTQSVFAPFIIGPPNQALVSPANPTGTTSGTGVMMGIGGTATITPGKTGNILVTITGNSANASAITAKFGTGTAPANGAAPTGTSFGTTATGGTFLIQGLINQATIAVPVVPVWIDLDLAASSGTATVTNLAVTMTEQ